MSDDSDDRAVRTFGTGNSRTDSWEGLRRNSDSKTTEKAVATQQDDTDDPHHRIEWYDPRYDPRKLALLVERSETHKACVHAKAKATAGYGFDIVPHEHAESDDPPGEEAIREFWHGDDSAFQLGPDARMATPTDVLEAARRDYEAIGWYAIEVLINDTTGEPTGLAHIPAHTIRVRRDEPGYVQIDPDTQQEEAFFGAAGMRYGDEKTFIDVETGESGSTTGDVDTPANELIFDGDYSPLAPHYGVPDVLPAVETLQGDLAARQFNRRFFENDGVPRFAVIVEGGQLSDDAWTELEQKFAELRLEENSHRGVILEAVSGVTNSFEDAHNVSLRIEPLTVGTEEDASFIEYRRENEHDLMKAHSVPPVVLNRTESVNYSNAKMQLAEFAQSTIRPRQQAFAARLHKTIHQTMLGVDGWTIEFELHGGQNRLREAEIQQFQIEGTGGTLTVDEAREIQDLEPLGAPTGNMLVSELGSSSGSNPSPSSEEDAIDAARGEERADQLGYSITARADDD